MRVKERPRTVVANAPKIGGRVSSSQYLRPRFAAKHPPAASARLSRRHQAWSASPVWHRKCVNVASIFKTGLSRITIMSACRSVLICTDAYILLQDLSIGWLAVFGPFQQRNMLKNQSDRPRTASKSTLAGEDVASVQHVLQTSAQRARAGLVTLTRLHRTALHPHVIGIGLSGD